MTPGGCVPCGANTPPCVAGDKTVGVWPGVMIIGAGVGVGVAVAGAATTRGRTRGGGVGEATGDCARPAVAAKRNTTGIMKSVTRFLIINFDSAKITAPQMGAKVVLRFACAPHGCQL